MIYTGQTGIEYIFEDYLRGKNGIKQIDMSVDGGTVGEYTEKEAISGSNVVLTIDANLQAITEKALKDTIENAKDISETAKDSDAGAIVVMNIKTGEVLALASYPYFDPVNFVGGIDPEVWSSYIDKKSNDPLLNRAIGGTYAPGSTYKMVTSVAALESGNVTTSERINDTGVYPRRT